MSKKSSFAELIGHVFLHLVFWCGILFFYTYFFGYQTEDFNYVLSFSTFLMPITIGTTYVFIYKLIPDYLIPKRYFRFGVYTLYTLIISSYLIVLSVFYGLIYLSNFNIEGMAPLSRNIHSVTVAVYFVVILVSAFKLLQLTLKQSTKQAQLESEILESQLKLKMQELQHLKMQIHPHFLFNTLNTLYGFALQKSDKTPEMILKLSNLLDYILYQTDKPKVSINEEVSHIKDYISLEKIRFGERLVVDFEGTSFSETIHIAPMLLLPFVENSFKHGALKNGLLKIKIRLKFNNNSIDFYIENTADKENVHHSGIGLENIKRRLELIYKNDYDLDIKFENDRFKVSLNLKTNPSIEN